MVIGFGCYCGELCLMFLRAAAIRRKRPGSQSKEAQRIAVFFDGLAVTGFCVC